MPAQVKGRGRLAAFWRSLPWLMAAALLVWAVRQAPLPAAAAALSRLQPWQLGVLAVANAAVVATLTCRWWIILRGLGYRLPFLTLAGHRQAGSGVSYFTPGPQFGGEPVQVLLLERSHAVPRATAVAAVTLDRLLDLLVNLLFLSGGVLLLLQQQLFPRTVGWPLAAGAGGLLLLPLLFLWATWRGRYPVAHALDRLRRLPWPARLLTRAPAWRPVTAALRSGEVEATRFCRRAPRRMVAALLASLAGWSLMLAEFWLMWRLLAVPLSPLQVILLLTAARVAFLLPLPGGLGTLEAGQTLALQAMGLDPALGLGASLLIRARDVTLALVGLGWGALSGWRTPGVTAVQTGVADHSIQS